ncbi:MAG TPA: Gldg family protein [Gammaproteobacteria bacterium]|nr:Gldg family protein [Gammaproteobacteria bacterium]
MSTRSRHTLGALTLVILLLAFFAAVMASNTLLRGFRIDLTQNKLYTLAPGTRSVLQNIAEPINLYLFFSDEATKSSPQLRTYETRVREMLDELVAHAPDGKLLLHVLDPVPFSEEEDRAEQFGVTNIGTMDQPVYFGLAGTNSIGKSDVIPLFLPDSPERPPKEQFLEYDLAKLVYNLAHPNKTVIGLLSGAPMSGSFDPQTQQPTQPWIVAEQARQLFEIRALQPSTLRVDDDINVLWIVQPADLEPSTLYAIDQFVMRGGRALIFLDPFAEIMAAGGQPQFGTPAPSSTLEPLLAAWGVKFSPTEVVADSRYALRIRAGQGGAVRHLGIIGLDKEAMSQEDVLTSGVETVNLDVAGHFTLEDGATAKLTPLLRSSNEAAILTSDRFQFLPDPAELLTGFKPTGTQYVLAARLEGALKSAYPDGPPKAEKPEGRDAPVDTALASQHIASTENASIVLVGDVDMLSDRLWAQAQSFLGQRIVSAFANNGDFVFGALDNLSGSADLIGLRSRATFTRPFTRVEKLQRDADARFSDTEKQLQAELSETEQKLGELQSARKDQSSLLMSPEQQTEIQRFLDEQVRIRGELRTVRRDLDRDIDNLGTTLKILNVLVWPLLLTGIALGIVVWRRGRKAAPR